MIHNWGQPAGAVLLYEPRSSEDCGAFGSLPDDLIVAIGAQLGAPDLARLALLSRRFGLDRGPMRTHVSAPGGYGDTAWSSLAEQSAKRAYFCRHAYFRGVRELQVWSKPRFGCERRFSYLISLRGVDEYANKIAVEEAGPDAMISGGGDTLRATRASRFICRHSSAPYPGIQCVEFTLVKSGQGGALIGLVGSRLDWPHAPQFTEVDWQQTEDLMGGDGGDTHAMSIYDLPTWLFDTESGALVHSDGIDLGQNRPRPWGLGVDDTGFVKEGSVIRMEVHDLHTPFKRATLTVYVDGRRLGELTTESDEDEETQDFPIGPLPSRFRWCGIASAGAELRIDGPKPPMSA